MALTHWVGSGTVTQVVECFMKPCRTLGVVAENRNRSSGEVEETILCYTASSRSARTVDPVSKKSIKIRGWRGGSVVQSTGRCSCGGPALDSQQPHGGSQPFVTQVSGGSDDFTVPTRYTDIHIQAGHPHVSNNKIQRI